MGNGQSSGIFYFQHTGERGTFPKELRRGLLTRFEPRFTLLFLGLLILISLSVALLSIRKAQEGYSDKEISKIQERYAQLMMNQPKVEVVPPKVVEHTVPQQIEGEGGVGEGGGGGKGKKVNREKESYVEREARRAAGSGSRAEARAQVDREVSGSGIFAAITANSGPASSGRGSEDLLGNAGSGLSDIGSMNITKGTFASTGRGKGGSGSGGGGGGGDGDGDGLSERSGGRVSGIGIEKGGLGRAGGAKIATNATVNITSTAAPKVSGETGGAEARSPEAIQGVMTHEMPRLKRVFEEWVKRDPTLGGTLRIRVTILPDGSVSNAVVVKSTTGNADFDQNIIRYLMRMHFEQASGAGLVEAEFPFAFSGQG